MEMKSLNGYEIVDAKAREEILFIKNGTVTPEMYGAVGDGETDDTIALQNMFASGHLSFFFTRKYRVVSNVNLILHTFDTVKGITIQSSEASAIIIDNPNPDNRGVECFLRFAKCEDVYIKLNLIGNCTTLSQIGDYGCTAIRLDTCKNVTVDAYSKYSRYVVQVFASDFLAGDICENITVRGRCDQCGYFVSAYSVKNLDVRCKTNKVSRSVWVAGAENVTIENRYTMSQKTHNIIVSNQGYINGYKGVKNARIKVLSESIDYEKEDPNSFFLNQNAASCGISVGLIKETTGISVDNMPTIFENVFFEYHLYGRGRGCCIDCSYDMEISCENIRAVAYDYRDPDYITDQVLFFSGAYCDKIPVIFSIGCDTGRESKQKIIAHYTANGKKTNANLTVIASRLEGIESGNITLVDCCHLKLRRANTFTMIGEESHVLLADGSDISCTNNGNSCMVYFNAKSGQKTSDHLLNKSSAVITSLIPTNYILQSVLGDGTIKTLYNGMVTPEGVKVHFPPLESKTIQVTAAQGNNAIVTLII